MKISALRIVSEKSQMLWKDIIQRNAHFKKIVELGVGKKTVKDWKIKLENTHTYIHTHIHTYMSSPLIYFTGAVSFLLHIEKTKTKTLKTVINLGHTLESPGKFKNIWAQTQRF